MSVHEMLTGIYIATCGIKPVIERLEELVRAEHAEGFVTYKLESPNHDEMLHDPPDEKLIITVHLPPWCFLGNVQEKLLDQMRDEANKLSRDSHGFAAAHRITMYQQAVRHPLLP